MISFIFLLCLALSSASRIDLAAVEDPLSGEGHQLRADYIEALQQEIECFEADVGVFGISVIQAAPPEALRSVHVVLQASREDGSKVSPPSFVQEDGENGNIKLTAYYELEELTDAFGCIDIPESDDYFGKICYFSMDYVGTDSMLVLSTIEYSLAVRIPKHQNVEYVIAASKIYKELCDCVIDNDYELQVEAYTDADCEIPLNGETLIYGALICLKVTTDDPLASRFIFNPTSVLMVYKDINGGDRTVEMIPLAQTRNGAGFSEIVMDVLTVGDYISYTITVVLEGGMRALIDVDLKEPKSLKPAKNELKEGEGLQGRSTQYKVIRESDSKTDDKPSSSASALAGSAFTLLSLIGFLVL